MMLLCIKQHLSNIWDFIHENVKATLRLSWKKALLVKKRVFVSNILARNNKKSSFVSVQTQFSLSLSKYIISLLSAGQSERYDTKGMTHS